MHKCEPGTSSQGPRAMTAPDLYAAAKSEGGPDSYSTVVHKPSPNIPEVTKYSIVPTISIMIHILLRIATLLCYTWDAGRSDFTWLVELLMYLRDAFCCDSKPLIYTSALKNVKAIQNHHWWMSAGKYNQYNSLYPYIWGGLFSGEWHQALYIERPVLKWHDNIQAGREHQVIRLVSSTWRYSGLTLSRFKFLRFRSVGFL